MDSAIEKIIASVIENEGGEKVTNDPLDGGGRTQFGISERSHPEAWEDDKVTLNEAQAIYVQRYVVAPGFDKLSDHRLIHQLVDFGVNSGPFIAIQKLQMALDVKQDGVLGPKTLEAANKADGRKLNNDIVAIRVKFLCKLCVKRPSQLRFLEGWVDRALEFLI